RAIGVDLRGGGWEIALAEFVHKLGGASVRVRYGPASVVLEVERMQTALAEAAIGVQRHVEVDAVPGGRIGTEDAAATEVAEAVRDEPPTVELHPPQRVGAMAEGEVGTRVDGGMGEGDDVAAVLAV